MVSNRPPNLQETEEKLKNPQEPRTQAPESQEGLKQFNDAGGVQVMTSPGPESQEGLKLPARGADADLAEGLPRISRRVETKRGACYMYAQAV